MAIAIKSIPTLKNDQAAAFIAKAEQAASNRGTVKFAKQVKVTNAILEKSKKR